MIASVGRSQCVHANGFIVLKLVATTLGEISSTLFRYFTCSVNSALEFFTNMLQVRNLEIILIKVSLIHIQNHTSVLILSAIQHEVFTAGALQARVGRTSAFRASAGKTK